MRVLVTTFPGLGHFHPVAPLALALQRAGHGVRVATNPELGDWVRACGLVALAAGMSLLESVERVAGFALAERTVKQFTSVAVPSFVDDVLRASEHWRPDVVVSEEGEHAGPLVAALLGARSVTHSWPTPARPSDERAARVDALRDVWRAFGRTEQPRLYGREYLDCCPPPLQTGDIDGIDGVRAVRPSAFDGPPTAPPDWLNELVPPVALVTLGTVPVFARADVLSTIVRAMGPQFGTVVVTTGPNLASVIEQSANVRVVPYLPLSIVLPMTDLVVSHGGAGTTTACLLAGVRHLVFPQGAPSQQRAADRVSELGLGRSMDATSLDEQTIGRIAAELLADAEITQRISAARAAIDSLPDPDELARGYT